MASIKQRWDVCAGKPYVKRDGEEKKLWINVGKAVEWDDGNISIELHSMPVGNWFDWKLSLFVQKYREQSKPQSIAPTKDDFDDSTIPF